MLRVSGLGPAGFKLQGLWLWGLSLQGLWFWGLSGQWVSDLQFLVFLRFMALEFRMLGLRDPNLSEMLRTMRVILHGFSRASHGKAPELACSLRAL